VLLTLDRDDAKARALFESLLRDGTSSDHSRAVAALASAAAAGKALAPALTPLLRAESPYLRIQAARAVWTVGGDVDAAREVLGAALKARTSSSVRMTAASVLGGLGPGAKALAPALAAALSDRDPAVRLAAAGALRKIDPEAADRAGLP